MNQIGDVYAKPELVETYQKDIVQLFLTKKYFYVLTT